MRATLLLTLLISAPALAGVSAEDIVGTWKDPEGAVYEIAAGDKGPHVASATFTGTEPMEVGDSEWTGSSLEFNVSLPRAGVQVRYKVLDVSEDRMDTVWWSSTGQAGREVLERLDAPSTLLGVWEDRSVRSRYWVRMVDGIPMVTGGLDRASEPRMVVGRKGDGKMVGWSVFVPGSGYSLTYECKASANADELSCTWSNTSPSGQQDKGIEVLRRVAP